jgi:transcriptional regulator with XRE-family HTH domain
MLRIGQRELAERSGVSLETVKRVERLPGAISTNVRTAEALRTALEAAGIQFTNGDAPGVRLRRE